MPQLAAKRNKGTPPSTLLSQRRVPKNLRDKEPLKDTKWEEGPWFRKPWMICAPSIDG